MNIERVRRLPGDDHPISIVAESLRVRVMAGGRLIADSTRALVLREASYQPVHYIPREDVDMSALVRSHHTTYCPYKGDCNYYSIPAGGDRSLNAVWTYENPFDAVAAIAGHLAFYPNRVDTITLG